MKHYMFVVTTLGGGGAERVVSVLSSELAKTSKVTVLAYYKAEEEYDRSSDVNVVYMTKDGDSYDGMNYYHRLTNIRRIIKREDPDYVIPFLSQVCMQVTVALLGTKYKVIQTVRNDPATLPASKIVRVFRDRLVKHSYKTIVQNENQKDYFPKSWHKKIFVLFNPVSEELLSNVWEPNTEEYIICGVGRLDTQKNFPLLIDSFLQGISNMPNAVLRIYGDGPLAKELQQYINKTGLSDRIILMGRTTDIGSVYKKASLFVLSSDYEGMPNALIEAMAVGVPCIATDCPTGPSDLIRSGENGLLVPMRNVDAMASAMAKMYMDTDRCKKISSKAKQTIWELCAPEQIAKQMRNICN